MNCPVSATAPIAARIRAANAGSSLSIRVNGTRTKPRAGHAPIAFVFVCESAILCDHGRLALAGD